MNDRYIDIVQAGDDAKDGMRAFPEERRTVWKE
jgi:hypothetical protein